MKRKIIALVGLRGSGKTTIAKIFYEHGFYHISVGNIMRHYMNGKNIKKEEVIENLHGIWGKKLLLLFLK